MNFKNSASPNSENNEHIEELAGLLAQNHVNISLSKQVSENHNKVYKKVFVKGPFQSQAKYTPLRCIVVVGAGADHNACTELMLGGDVADALKTTLTKNNPTLVKLVKNELERLKRIYKLNPKEFETVLFALNKYFPKKLMKELDKRFNHQYNPCFTYEILAHLMKHRFIDAIINFNFSELLDQSIKDELKDDEYHKIIFDGDVDSNTFDQDEYGELKLPLYIKPHGTISHKSTLRFTEEAYYGLPSDIETALINLIKATWKPKKGVPKPMDVILIVMGFNMQSSEFRFILNKNLPPNSRLFIINGEKNNEDKKKSIPKIGYSSIKKGEKQINLENIINNNSKVIPKYHDDFMKKLWGFVEETFSSDYEPRKILRHQLIGELFNEKERLRDKDIVKKYLWQRAYVEFALSFSKYKGFFTTNQIEDDRFGKYFHLAMKNGGKVTSKNLIEFITKFDLEDIGYGNSKAFTLKGNRCEASATNPLTITKDDFLKSELYQKIKTKLVRIIRSKGKNIKDFIDLLEKTFTYILDEGDTEISSKYDKVYGHIFTNPTIIKSQLEFKYKTNLYFEEDWDKLYIVAETGEWVAKLFGSKKLLDPISGKKKNLVLIYADLTQNLQVRKLHRKYRGNLLWIPWWEHNQHMTLFFKDKKINHAFYYTRRLRSSLINPVELKDENDLELLKETFATYFIKAKKGVKIIPIRSVDVFIKKLFPKTIPENTSSK